MSQSDNSADRSAAAAVRGHHAQLAKAVNGYTEQLMAALDRADHDQAESTRQELLSWLHTELMPHALAEETSLYPAAAARPSGRLLVEGMLDEHRAIVSLVEEVETAVTPLRAAAAARALSAVFETHLTKENDLIVPLLADAADVSLAELLDGMHALLGAASGGEAAAGPDQGAGCGCGGCGCGGDAAGSSAEAAVLSIDPRLDVRDIPHEGRHAAALSALAEVPPGGALVLVAPHAPRPLLAEVEWRFHGQFDVDWLQDGPAVWQVRLQRSRAMV